MPTRIRGKAAGRSELARDAHFRTGGGAMGGSRKLQAKRRRRADRLEEQRAAREREQAE
ncbi:MAG: hypothetical protein ACK47B_07330 [Armatimonadota bacterium]